MNSAADRPITSSQASYGYLMLYFLSIAGMIAVSIVLALGLTNMARGGTASRSQKLMRLRIAFQFFAVVAVMTALYFSTRT